MRKIDDHVVATGDLITEGDSSIALTRYGEFESQALAVTYEFTLPPPRGQEAQLLRTKLHEEAHLFQTLTTPYGLYINLVREVQSALVNAMLLGITNVHGLRPRFPLQRQILRLRPAGKYARLYDLLRWWLVFELVVLFFESDWHAWYSAASGQLRWLGLSSFSISDLFTNAELKLVEYLYQFGMLAHQDSSWTSHLDEKTAAAQERLWASFRAAMPSGDVRSVLEAGATAAEYWGADPKTLSPVQTQARDRTSLAQDDLYSPWLMAVAQAIPGVSPQGWIQTVLALTDLSLGGPILPQYSGARLPNASVLEFHPAWRMWYGVHALHKVGPLEDIRDYQGFTDAVCAHNGWAIASDCNLEASRQLGHLAESRGVYLAESRDLAWVFSKALDTRLGVPFAFLSGSFWDDLSTSPNPEYGAYFQPLVIEYDGRIFVHKDREYLSRRLVAFVRSTYLRTLFIGGRPEVSLPFAASDETIDDLATAVDDGLRATGITVPRVSLRVAPRRARRVWEESHE